MSYKFIKPAGFFHKPNLFIFMSVMMAFGVPFVLTLFSFMVFNRVFGVPFPNTMEPYLLVLGVIAAGFAFVTSSASSARGIMDGQRRDYLEAKKIEV